MSNKPESRIHLRGFGSMTTERKKEIASQGGRAAQESGRCHRWNSKEARAAGKKGGLSMAKKVDKSYWSELGRRGGLARQEKQESGEE